jgi:hypothetical protein
MQGVTLFTYSSERHEGNILPTCSPFGTPEQALDRGCAGPTARCSRR